MGKGSRIETVTARQVFSMRGHPGIEAKVITENGACGVALATAGLSIGEHEIPFLYDGGERWGGMGVTKAVDNVKNIIGPAIKGADASKQRNVDEILIELRNKIGVAKLGGNATASVSAAVLIAGAMSLGIPLYQHVGGVNACTLPVPGAEVGGGNTRYGHGEGGGDKPSFSFQCYDFDTFADASYAGVQVQKELQRLIKERFNMTFPGRMFQFQFIQAGMIEHDREIWEIMTEAINRCGYEGKVGIQMDSGACTYYDKEKKVYTGIFSRGEKTRDEMIELYKEMVRDYPFVILEDPLDENDYEGHAILAKELGIQIVGDDLFTTNVERLKHGIEVGACNVFLLKVNQVGTITEAFDTVLLAKRGGYDVMPCGSRGEGIALVDYTVGLGAGTTRGGAIGPSADRFMEIEEELGSKAKFWGKAGLKGSKFRE